MNRKWNSVIIIIVFHWHECIETVTLYRLFPRIIKKQIWYLWHNTIKLKHRIFFLISILVYNRRFDFIRKVAVLNQRIYKPHVCHHRFQRWLRSLLFISRHFVLSHFCIHINIYLHDYWLWLYNTFLDKKKRKGYVQDYYRHDKWLELHRVQTNNEISQKITIYFLCECIFNSFRIKFLVHALIFIFIKNWETQIHRSRVSQFNRFHRILKQSLKILYALKHTFYLANEKKRFIKSNDSFIVKLCVSPISLNEIHFYNFFLLHFERDCFLLEYYFC